MENKNKNQPAFPSAVQFDGLSKREYAAIMAMQGILANSFNDGTNKPLYHASFEEIAKMAVNQADALLKALETPKQ